MVTKSQLTLENLDKFTRKNKLPSVQDLISQSLKTTQITKLADQIGGQYGNVHQVLRRQRKLPLVQTVLLCELHGIPIDTALLIYAVQDINEEVAEKLAPQLHSSRILRRAFEVPKNAVFDSPEYGKPLK